MMNCYQKYILFFKNPYIFSLSLSIDSMLPSNYSYIESHLDLRMGTLAPDRKMKSVGIAVSALP